MDSLKEVQNRFDQARSELDARTTSGAESSRLTLAELALVTGDPRRALEEVRSSASGATGDGELDPLAQRIALRALLRSHEYAGAERLTSVLLEDRRPVEAEDRSLCYEWLFLTGDLKAVDRRTRDRFDRGDTTSVADLLAAGRLRLALLDPDEAEVHYRAALRHSSTAPDRASALTGLARVEQKRLDWDRSLELLSEALSEDVLDPDPLLALVSTRIRRGETEAAIAANELALLLDPFSEPAHYTFGNGYAGRNYTQLFADYPEAFADSTGQLVLAEADRALDAGRIEDARAAYSSIAVAHPEWADVRVRLGSLEFSQANYEAALGYFQAGLALCPEFGRAHHGIAKVFEQKLLAFNVHRAEDDRAFAEAPAPELPGIENFVVNWPSLALRHQKRVALSLEPWSRYLPVLIAGGHTCYIKPIYQLLSDTPGQEALRDQRISYDSRLWDDVRGCGGYHTVTGIEDVERTIYRNYDTVLHELTHQVHGVLPPETAREIEELYRNAKDRDGGTGNAFLSRYAGGSVWEYFAEGANSESHPRRDSFDPREIARERLATIDPALQALVLRLERDAPLQPCYPITYANRGNDELERGRPEAAIAAYREALALDRSEPNALGSLVYALQVADRANEAVAEGDRAARLHPMDGDLAVRRANASWHAGTPLHDVIGALADARPHVRKEDLATVDLELGRLQWILGDADAAVAAYGRALEVQEDMPEAIWGRALALALAGDWSAAWTEYERAVRSRTGIVELRCDYARDLLRAGEQEGAAQQVEAARLLDPTDPNVRTLGAWLSLNDGRPEEARREARSVTEEAPWCFLASLVEISAASAIDQADLAQPSNPVLHQRIDTATPRYVYRAKWGRYDEVDTFPAVERGLIEPGGALAPSRAPK